LFTYYLKAYDGGKQVEERRQQFFRLLDVVNPIFQDVAVSDGWELKRNLFRHPSRELHKRSLSGRTTFIIGLMLEPSWGSEEAAAKFPDELPYNFGVVVIQHGATPREQVSHRVNFVEHGLLSQIVPEMDKWMEKALRFVREYVEPPEVQQGSLG